MEYGLFDDEGCVEAGFYSIEEAENALTDRYTSDDELSVLEPDPADHARHTCEMCARGCPEED